MQHKGTIVSQWRLPLQRTGIREQIGCPIPKRIEKDLQVDADIKCKDRDRSDLVDDVSYRKQGS